MVYALMLGTNAYGCKMVTTGPRSQPAPLHNFEGEHRRLGATAGKVRTSTLRAHVAHDRAEGQPAAMGARACPTATPRSPTRP